MVLATAVTDVAALIVALSLVITAIAGAFVQVRTQLRIERGVQQVHNEVRTGNGQTLGMLADIAEGRAAQAIPIADRTRAEQKHSDMEDENERRDR